MNLSRHRRKTAAALGILVLLAGGAFAWAQTPGAGLNNDGISTGIAVPDEPAAPSQSSGGDYNPPSGGSSGPSSSGGGYDGPSTPTTLNCFGAVIQPPCQGPSLPSQPGPAVEPVAAGPAPTRPAPPPPPSAAEVRNSTPLPDADLNVDPNELGLTGLDTEFWTTTTQSVTSTSTLRGYTVTATARPTSYSWDFGDGNTASGERVQYEYQTRGTFTITLTITYEGSFQWSGNGRSGSGSLGSVTHESSRSYKVIEARGTLGPVS